MNPEALQQALHRALLGTDFYDHPVSAVEHIETHISHVYLAGEFAYKVKKPVDFGFLNFSTSALRRFYCAEEVRLNRRFAPELYLGVVTIGGTPSAPRLHGTPPLEYAVKMRRFAQDEQLDRMLSAGRLTPEHLERFAEHLCNVHTRAQVAPADSRYGCPAAVLRPVLENFRQIRHLSAEPETIERLDHLDDWSRRTFRHLAEQFRQRRADGRIRECHGDIHLRNMAWIDAAPVFFDCIEFNPNLRWIDPLNDVAFLAMDLDDRDESELAGYFVNRYLQQSGDYQGALLLNFYQVYRALVRAKVTALRFGQDDLSPAERRSAQALFDSYLALAEAYSRPRRGALLITHGPTGSGKSSFARHLAPRCNALSLHSDLERKRLWGLQPTESSGSALDSDMYTPEMTRRTYARLHQLAVELARNGRPCLLDATYLDRSERNTIRRMATSANLPVVILDFQADQSTLLERIAQRAAQSAQISEGTADVLAAQLQYRDPLDTEEQRLVIPVGPESSAARVAAEVQRRIG